MDNRNVGGMIRSGARAESPCAELRAECAARSAAKIYLRPYKSPFHVPAHHGASGAMLGPESGRAQLVCTALAFTGVVWTTLSRRIPTSRAAGMAEKSHETILWWLPDTD